MKDYIQGILHVTNANNKKLHHASDRRSHRETSDGSDMNKAGHSTRAVTTVSSHVKQQSRSRRSILASIEDDDASASVTTLPMEGADAHQAASSLLMASLPDELQTLALSFLTPRQLSLCCAVCRSWGSVKFGRAASNIIWQPIVQDAWPQLIQIV